MASPAMTYSRAGLDPTFLTDDEFFSALFAQQDYTAMTRGRGPLASQLLSNALYVDPALVGHGYNDVSLETDSPNNIGSDGHGGSISGRSISVSPHTASLVYTPESGMEIYDDLIVDSHEHVDEDGSDAIVQTSPSSGSHVASNSMGSESGGDHRSMDNNRPPPSSGMPSSGTQSPSPSLVPSNSQPQQQHHHHQWSSFASTTATGGWMDSHSGGHYGLTDTHMTHDFVSANYAATGYESDLLTGVENFDDIAAHNFGNSLPYRSMEFQDNHPSFLPRQYIAGDGGHMGHSEYREHTGTLQFAQLHQAQSLAQIPPAGTTSTNHIYRQVNGHQLHTDVADMQGAPTSGRARNPSRPLNDSAPTQKSLERGNVEPLAARSRRPHHQPKDGQSKVNASGTAVRPLQPAVPGQRMARSASQADRMMARRGGRRKHTHLPDQTRVKSHKMRKTGACWGCALQRDPCPDEGTPCQRCIAKAQKGHIYYFPCDRSKLPDLVLDFLPPSMTLMHQKQSIEDCVTDQVLRWEDHNGIDIRLTCGYGPALEWRVYEFVPRTMELLGQYQYRQNMQGMTQRLTKYSPPLGLMQIDTSDSIRAESYLDRALQPKYLDDFGWTCFEEESQVNYFQASMLQSMCELYLRTDDDDLQSLLQKIIRMMAITYIMGHTLTIQEDDFFSVMNSINRTGVPTEQQPFTSPRLANRQLKFFFSILRGTIYDNILNWQQQTLHSSTKRESTWLAAFCVMIGFAMVLEEAQHTIILQADAKISKQEMTAEAANKEAENACQRIDDRYTFLIRLFQSKYRDKKWTQGSFGNGTPELKDPHAQVFLRDLHANVVENLTHLQARREVQFKPEHQSIYTSRLVARFLLPFLGLPP